MKRELDEALVRDFPNLYADRNGDYRNTAMIWGFPESGWEPIIRKLSQKLEYLIIEMKVTNPNARCMCGCTRFSHINDGECMHTYRMPLWKSPITWSFRRLAPLNNIFLKKIQDLYYWFITKVTILSFKTSSWICFNTIFHKEQRCSCKRYRPDLPRASQVKEKFGSLHYYLTCGTDEMWAAINEAEEQSRHICEECGNPGETRYGSWDRTLCNKCAESNGFDLED